jgi:glucose-6-phosphate 1-dehydrogenase
MSEPHSAALVFFGATGDLAYKKIFPSLQAMVCRCHPVCPGGLCGGDLSHRRSGSVGRFEKTSGSKDKLT